ncbi:hypothetical protein FRX31_024158 [Thalictrum thalictroides]|uniref:Uncharacterized protein n=1 Tax=Thalictrum thalictroides TaxID=46969 RepID=A0A7J6VMD2_THATH|nr:hypothetical protein FRX31_024158 [Thalictrum thalictroides]
MGFKAMIELSSSSCSGGTLAHLKHNDNIFHTETWLSLGESNVADSSSGFSICRAPDTCLLMDFLKEILLRRPVAATIGLTNPTGAARPAPSVGPALFVNKILWY